MPIDMGNLVFGEELVDGQEYMWRVTGVWVKESNNTHSKYINMNATVADGPALGQQARMPMIMLFSPAHPEKTLQYMVEAANKLAKILGVPPTAIILPQQAGENTPSIDALINSLFVAKAKWVPDKTDEKTGRVYEAHFETGPTIRALAENEVESAGADYAAFFED